MGRQIFVLGGGTLSHVRTHLALAAPAYGQTARRIARLWELPVWDATLRGLPDHIAQGVRAHEASEFNAPAVFKDWVRLILTRMAGEPQGPETPEAVGRVVEEIIRNEDARVVFFNVAMVDFHGAVAGVESGKYADRLKTSDGEALMRLTPSEKVIQSIRKTRKDIFLVGFKTTTGETPRGQYVAGMNLLKQASCNLVLANDVRTRVNMVLTPEEAAYHVTTDRGAALEGLVEMAKLRSLGTFTRSTVVPGDPVDWWSEDVPASLRKVVNHCIDRGAYKAFRGSTVGHFAVRVGDGEFLTSRRKTDFNSLSQVGLVRVRSAGDNEVVAEGSRPSVGGQSQRIVFREHPDVDCIVHFHCPLKPGSQVPVRSQREFECGSHECGKNTSSGLTQMGPVKAVMLDKHGPNVVFNRNTDPQDVIRFIEENFDLSEKTGQVG